MSYLALYRKWRPQTFDEVVEQDFIKIILKNTIAANRIGHAYLFCGTRGTGKTTMAKIFSRAINCEQPIDSNPCNTCEICRGILTGGILDVVEIDAASNNSVDNIREIRDEVIYTPAKAKYKVYIIDEVHMLSTGAFNALLKTLEEPPSYVVFILATTEPHKLPITILSRCQRYDFKRISLNSIAAQLKKISSNLKINIEDEASLLIANLADGALRDGISILDQCMSLAKDTITYQDVISIVGIIDSSVLAEIIDNIYSQNIFNILNTIDELVSYGKDLAKFTTDLINYLRNLLIAKISNSLDPILGMPHNIYEKLKIQTDYWSIEEISLIIKDLSNLDSSLKWSVHPKTLMEVELIKLCDKNYFNNNLNIEERITVLETKMNNFKEIVLSNSNNSAPPNQNENKDGIILKNNPPSNNTKNKKKLPPINSKNYLDIWPQIVEESKSSANRLLYELIKNSNALLSDQNTVNIIIYDQSKIDFLKKPEYMDYIDAELTKYLNREIKAKFVLNTVKNSSGEDVFFNKIDNLNNVISIHVKD